MIKINLLPTKKIRTKMGIRQELLLSGLLLLWIVILLGLVWGWQTNKIEGFAEQKKQKEQQLDELKKVVAEVEQFKKDKELYEQRINIIKDLEAQQSGPVHILDELSLNITDKLWFDSLSLKGSTLTLSGSAFANIAIVDFINNLKRSPYFYNVQLLESKLAAQDKARAYVFKLSTNVKIPEK